MFVSTFNGLACFKQVKINFSTLCSSTFELGLTMLIAAVFFFFNLKLYFYQEKISLTQKVLAYERKVKIKHRLVLKAKLALICTLILLTGILRIK